MSVVSLLDKIYTFLFRNVFALAIDCGENGDFQNRMTLFVKEVNLLQ